MPGKIFLCFKYDMHNMVISVSIKNIKLIFSNAFPLHRPLDRKKQTNHIRNNMQYSVLINLPFSIMRPITPFFINIKCFLLPLPFEIIKYVYQFYMIYVTWLVVYYAIAVCLALSALVQACLKYKVFVIAINEIIPMVVWCQNLFSFIGNIA